MDYKNLLQKHGLKATPQRVGLLSIMEEAGHINIDDMYIAIKKECTSISLATLYKNIRAMMDSALVDEVKIPNQKPKYEIKKGSHGHLVCERCGLVEDMVLEAQTLMQTTTKESGFSPKNIHVVISGICTKCQKL